MYVDPADTCYSVYISYPGDYQKFTDSDFMPNDPNCIDYEKAYEGWFTANDRQWFEGLSSNT